MPKKTVYFRGFLANVDSSILRMRLDHGFKVKDMSDDEARHVIPFLERLSWMAVIEKLAFLQCISEHRFYFVSNNFESDIKLTDGGVLKDSSPEVLKFNENSVEGYLEPVIQLMRLFKEGNIRMPLAHYYIIEKNIPQSVLSWSTDLYVTSELYKLESSEVSELRKFIRNTKLPFGKQLFLKLAFENFEWSYKTPNINLSFLSLMISLETLLNRDRHEIRYRLSRNTAVLLGKKQNDSQSIFREVKDLYDKRCGIVHTGQPNVINKEDLLKLRYYVRESIKEINKIDKNKDELIGLLNSCGFGERPWRK